MPLYRRGGCRSEEERLRRIAGRTWGTEEKTWKQTWDRKEGEACRNPGSFMTRSEAARWNRLAPERQAQYRRKGARALPRTGIARTGLREMGIGTEALSVEANTAKVFRRSLEGCRLEEQRLAGGQGRGSCVSGNVPEDGAFGKQMLPRVGRTMKAAVRQLSDAAGELLRRALAGMTVGIVCAGIVAASVLVIVLPAAGRPSIPAGGGLPPFLTEEMMQAFFEVQSEDRVPVSSGIAQLIAESGFGLFGPGGESGQGMSQLAWEYKNLFGVKYSSYDAYASGAVNMATGEQTAAGEGYETDAAFSVYPDYKACMKERARKLNLPPYYSRTMAVYPNKNDGTYTREDAVGFIQGIREAGWATDIRYVEKCVEIMERYDLYRFDNMTWEEYQSGKSGIENPYDGKVTPMMAQIVEAARTNGSLYPCTPDMCAAWVTGVYQAVGAPVIPYGNAIDMWNMYRGTGSSGKENIPPGAIVCGSGSGPMGALYGHVGIYIGDGLVANNVGRHSIEPLENWISWQSAECQGYVGWIGWVYPGGLPAAGEAGDTQDGETKTKK